MYLTYRILLFTAGYFSLCEIQMLDIRILS